MTALPIRLMPGQDLRRALEAAIAERGCRAAFVLSGIGSLGHAQLRCAGAPQARAIHGDTEILSVAGTLGPGTSHLHAVLAGADGAVLGGHLGYGCTVRTTAEVLLALLPDREFTREHDPATGFDELVTRRRPGAAPG
jgi:predicted DNA-binding protein with PD1-like motif